MYNMSGSSADPYVQVCVCTRSLETELLTLPFHRLSAALGKRLLGLQWVTSPKTDPRGVVHHRGERPV